LNFFDNQTKTFIFKLHNNILGITSRVAHFVRGYPHTCTFCDILQVPEENSKSTYHLFFECDVIDQLLTGFFNWIFNGHNIVVNAQTFFVTFNNENKNKNYVLRIICLLVKKYIWDCKVRSQLPVLGDLKLIICNDVKKMLKMSRTFRSHVIKSGLENESIIFRF